MVGLRRWVGQGSAIRGPGLALVRFACTVHRRAPMERDSQPSATSKDRPMSSGLEDRFQTLHEIVRAARRELPPGPWDYLVGGTETETTLRRNRQALDSIAFRPRVLRDVSAIDSTGTWFGEPVRLPVMLAPIGSVESFTPGGAATAAKAAARFGIPQMLSSACNPGLEATAAGGRHPPHLPALRPRRRRRGGRLGAPRAGSRLPGLLPHRGQRLLQPPRARPGPPVREAVAGLGHRPRVPAGSVVGSGQALQGRPPGCAARPQGHRHRGGRGDRLPPRGRGRVRLEPRGPPARSRPGKPRGPARGGQRPSGAARRCGSTGASSAARTS